MNQITIGNKFNYSSIIDGEEIYTLTTVNNSKQTINGDVLSTTGFTAAMYYVPENKWYALDRTLIKIIILFIM